MCAWNVCSDNLEKYTDMISRAYRSEYPGLKSCEGIEIRLILQF